MTPAVADSRVAGIGTEEHPLVHPVTGERIVFRKRARDTGGELLEMTLYLAPRGFIATDHVHPNQEERFEVAEAATLVQFRPALNTETFFETFFGLASDGKVGDKGLPNPLEMMVLATDYRREMQLPRPAQTVLGPIAMLVAPLARAFGYRGRYDRYSGPLTNNAT